MKKAPVFGAKGSSSSHNPMLKRFFEVHFYFQQFLACSALSFMMTKELFLICSYKERSKHV